MFAVMDNWQFSEDAICCLPETSSALKYLNDSKLNLAGRGRDVVSFVKVNVPAPVLCIVCHCQEMGLC